MLQSIFTFLGDAAVSVYTFLASVIGSGIGMIYGDLDGTGPLTEIGIMPFGELLLIGSAVGVGLWLLNWVIGLIPFANKR